MVQLSRLSMYGLASTTLCLYTILHAFRQRSNFYAAAVYLSKSNACTMILWNQGIFQTVMFGKFLQAIFFGELRLIEVERLQERGWFAVTETLLALTIFKDEFDSSFVLLFISLLFLKIFHWLAADRIELMEQSAHIPRLFHFRMVALLSWLWIFDALLLTFSVESILIDGPTVMIMFASEYMILLAMVWSSTMKYCLNVLDLRSEDTWEDKSIYVFYVDLATDFFKLVTYLSFFGLILTFYGLPLNILRDVYLTFRSFILKIRDLRRYRQATRNMDSLYPNASAEEMERMVDKMCIICREDMEYHGPPTGAPAAAAPGAAAVHVAAVPTPAARSGPNETPKKLPCGHVFHFHCLRSWLERQQSCPTCRRPVLASDQARTAAAAAAPPAPRPPVGPEEAIRQAQINLARNLGREAFAVVFPGIPFPPEAAAAPIPGHNPGNPPLAQPAAVPTPALTPAATPTLAPGAAANPTPTPAPTTNGPTPSPAATTTSTSASTSTPAASSSRAVPSTTSGGVGARTIQTNDNPLARFSLPDLRLPPGGEAALYSPPPHPSFNSPIANGYAGVAYGAAANQLRPHQPVPTAQAGRVPNLEERLAHIRTRMNQLHQTSATLAGTQLPTSSLNPTATPTFNPLATPTPAPAVTPNPATPLPTSATPTAPVSSPPMSSSLANKGNGDADPMLSRREAALAAAERRAQAARGSVPQVVRSPPPTTNSTFSATAPPVPSPLLLSSAPEKAPTSIPTSSPSTSPETPIASTSSTVPLPLQPASPPPRVGYPRLIPIFNSATSPGLPPASAYPNLFSSLAPLSLGPGGIDGVTRPVTMQPLVPEAPTEEQLKELSKLTRSGIEERLRVLVGFQDRMAALAKDMQTVLSVLPKEEEDVVAEKKEEEIKVDKGKTPVEGEGGDRSVVGKGFVSDVEVAPV